MCVRVCVCVCLRVAGLRQPLAGLKHPLSVAHLRNSQQQGQRVQEEERERKRATARVSLCFRLKILEHLNSENNKKKQKKEK